jgi:hypothetical protein
MGREKDKNTFGGYMDRHRKMDKHFNIKVNNKSVRILNYIRDSYYDNLKSEEIKTIELVTKIQ